MRYIVSLLFLSFTLLYGSFLMPNEAFKPHVEVKDGKVIATIDLADSIYLYKNRLKLSIKNHKDLLKDITYPKAELAHGEAIYKKSVTLTATLTTKDTKNLVAILKYQGCSEAGLCYEPYTKEFPLTSTTTQTKPLLKPYKNDVKKELSEVDTITQKLQSGNILLILATFFGFGILLALTPCVFPMIPILSSIIVSQKGKMSAKRGFTLSLVYVLSMSIAYTIAGVLAGLFGSNIQASMQNPWVLGSFSAIFVLLALSMFGFFELKLPSSVQSKITNHSERAGNKGGLLGVAIMGFLSALIVGPCVAPPLAGALVYIGQSGDALLGGAALFVMSLGMGLPLLIIGTSAGKFMPRPGVWMNRVSQIFGVLMLAIAIYMLNSIIDSTLFILTWGVFFIVTSVYMGAFSPFNNGWQALSKGLGIVTFIIGLLFVIGALGGATNIFKPLAPFSATNTVVQKQKELSFTKVQTLPELQKLLAQNKGKKIMVDFSAKWCSACKELEHITFADQRVKQQLQNFVLIQADITKNGAQQKELSKAYGVFGPPVLLFFNENGKLLESKKIVGYKNPQQFLKHLSSL